MSYGRNPHYIYSSGEHLNFEPYLSVPENLINAFLYKILLTTYRDDLKERLIQGKQEWMKKFEWQGDTVKDSFGDLIELPQDKDYVQWMEDNEDELLKKLMGEV